MEIIQAPTDPLYQQGFNEGYLIAKYLPAFTSSLFSLTNPSARTEGFNDGQRQYASEQQVKRLKSVAVRERLRGEIEKCNELSQPDGNQLVSV